MISRTNTDHLPLPQQHALLFHENCYRILNFKFSILFFFSPHGFLFCSLED